MRTCKETKVRSVRDVSAGAVFVFKDDPNYPLLKLKLGGYVGLHYGEMFDGSREGRVIVFPAACLTLGEPE